MTDSLCYCPRCGAESHYAHDYGGAAAFVQSCGLSGAKAVMLTTLWLHAGEDIPLSRFREIAGTSPINDAPEHLEAIGLSLVGTGWQLVIVSRGDQSQVRLEKRKGR